MGQGTVLGPLLWKIFEDDFKPSIAHVTYADDNALYIRLKRESANRFINSTSSYHILC